MIHQLVASSAYGLESVVRWELQQLGIDSRITSPGRIEFAGDDRILGVANLWLRTADRISIRIAGFSSPDFDALFELTKQIGWDQWIPQDGQIIVDAKSHKSQLTSVPAIQRTVKKALVDSLQQRYRTTTLSESGAVYHVTVWLQNDQAVLLLDTSGAGLRHRGYWERTKWSVMPETLAAGLILLSVWNADRPLLDPFAGQGIIPIEAALIGQNIPPGWQRSFAFEAWPFYDHRAWQDVKAEASQVSKTPLSHRLIGLDSNANVIRQAQQHAVAAGVQDAVHFQCQTYDSLQSSREFGCVITHPEFKTPATAEQRELYGSLPDVLRRLPTWSHFILTSHPSFERVVQKDATRRRKLYNGRTECTFYQYLGPKPLSLVAEANSEAPVSPGKMSTERTNIPAANPVFGGLPEKANEQADLFAARLRKRAKHLRRWPGRGIHCYRIYDRDIPEIPLVVDRYEDALHLTEYERPHDRIAGQHEAWLDLMAKTAGQTLDVAADRVFLKRRLRQKGNRQHQRMAHSQFELVVRENDLKFLVNLSDYVDTGLFLDHRQTRQMVRQEAEGKRVLNLFAYTGAFSVYAAAGGAASVTTIDRSESYIDWAKRNFQLNGLPSESYAFCAEDVQPFLLNLSSFHQYDLVIVDPPTFSNRKGEDNVWDVQRDHVELLNQLARNVAPNGVVYFSNNFRRFKLDEPALQYDKVIEITRQTIPEDFRNKRIHRCWKLIK